MAGFHAWLDELVSAMEPRPHHSGRGEVSSAGLPRHASAREPGSRSTAPARTPHTAHCTPHTATATAHRTPHAALRHRTPPPHTAHRTPPPHTARRHRTPRAQLASQAGRLAPAPRPARRSVLEPVGLSRLGEAAAPRRCGGGWWRCLRPERTPFATEPRPSSVVRAVRKRMSSLHLRLMAHGQHIASLIVIRLFRGGARQGPGVLCRAARRSFVRRFHVRAVSLVC